MSAKTIRSIQRAAKWITAIVICIICIGDPFIAVRADAAYHQAYIQTTIDTSNWTILAGVVDDSSGWTKAPLEVQRIRNRVLSGLMGTGSDPSSAAQYIDEDISSDDAVADVVGLPLSFPGQTRDGVFSHTSSTQADIDRASMVMSSIVFDLNEAFRLVYGADYSPDGDTLDARIDDYRDDMERFLQAVPGGSINGWSMREVSVDEPDGEDGRYVEISKGGKKQVFQFSVLKGYIDGGNATNLTQTSDTSKETKYVHWGHIAVEAFLNYKQDEKLQVTPDNVYVSEPGSLEKTLASLLGNLCNYIASALGMWSLDQLVFNEGMRGGYSYVGGVFPAVWQSYIWTFFFISEIFAIGILLFGIIFNIGKKALSTVDPVARASAITQIESLLFVGIALGLLPLAIQLLINVSADLTGIFADAIGAGGSSARERFGTLAASSGVLGATITQLIYLGAVVYMNFFYAIRSLTVAFLIITAPIFVSLVGVSEQKRGMAVAWAREFIADLFIQPVQALALSFILLLPSFGRTFDGIAMTYAMIPITHMARGLFFGNSGGMIHQLADRGRMKTMHILGQVPKTAANVLGTAAGAYLGGRAALDTATGEQGSGGSGGGGGRNDERHQTPPPPPSGTSRGNSSTTPPPPTAPGPPAAPQPTQMDRVTGGTDGDSSTASNTVTARTREREGASRQTADTGQQGGQGPKSAALTAAAVGLGFLGGAYDQINRRVFRNPSSGGGFLTQVSGSLAQKASGMRGSTPGPDGAASPASTDEVPPDDNNAYDLGLASKCNYGDGTFFRIEKDDMEGAGVRISSDKESGTATLSYDMGKLSRGDADRAKALASIYQDGSPEEKAALAEMGILGAGLQTKMVDGQEAVTGLTMSVEPKAFKEEFGIDVRPPLMGGKGLEVAAPAGTSAPRIVPDAVQQLGRKSFGSSVQALGGSMAPSPGGGAQVAIPTQQMPEFTARYPSIDVSTAQSTAEMATFSVPSEAMVQIDRKDLSVQDYGGSVTQRPDGGAQVSLPMDRMQDFSAQYQEIDTSAAQPTGGMTTFSVPAESMAAPPPVSQLSQASRVMAQPPQAAGGMTASSVPAESMVPPPPVVQPPQALAGRSAAAQPATQRPVGPQPAMRPDRPRETEQPPRGQDRPPRV